MRVPAYLLILLAVTGAGACAGPPAQVRDAAGLRQGASPSGQITLSGGGDLTTDDPAAIVYDRRLAPEGSQASATVESSGSTTRTSLVVEGFLPDRRYGAHIHVNPCGKKPEDSGPHYQNIPGRVDPVSEVWLDFTTDGEGAGRSSARNDWVLDPARLPRSLVIHAKPTVPTGPEAGQAAERIACLTLR
jgi:Cu-Zn family superoxide dismutase